MKDYTEQEFRSLAPMPQNIHNHIAYCLKTLFADREHTIREEIVQG